MSWTVSSDSVLVRFIRFNKGFGNDSVGSSDCGLICDAGVVVVVSLMIPVDDDDDDDGADDDVGYDAACTVVGVSCF